MHICLLALLLFTNFLVHIVAITCCIHCIAIIVCPDFIPKKQFVEGTKLIKKLKNTAIHVDAMI